MSGKSSGPTLAGSNDELAYEAVTQGIRVRIIPQYLEDQSDPAEKRWVWAYRVEIHNDGDIAVQLRDRHWEITDAAGRVQIVDGAGVVGKQPVLKPGHRFDYTSGCPLSTSSGFMVGHYTMVRLPIADPVAGDERLKTDVMAPFEVAIPAFSLDVPDASPARLH